MFQILHFENIFKLYICLALPPPVYCLKCRQVGTTLVIQLEENNYF